MPGKGWTGVQVNQEDEDGGCNHSTKKTHISTGGSDIISPGHDVTSDHPSTSSNPYHKFRV